VGDLRAMDEIEVSDRDIKDALDMMRALTGGEPYAPSVMPTAREIARIVHERVTNSAMFMSGRRFERALILAHIKTFEP